MTRTEKRGMTAEEIGIDPEDLKNWETVYNYKITKRHKANPKWC